MDLKTVSIGIKIRPIWYCHSRTLARSFPHPCIVIPAQAGIQSSAQSATTPSHCHSRENRNPVFCIVIPAEAGIQYFI